MMQSLLGEPSVALLLLCLVRSGIPQNILNNPLPACATRGSGYEFYPGLGYYKFHVELRSWMDAERECTKEGGHLAVINSLSESFVLRSMMARHPEIAGADQDTNNFALLGFHDMYIEGEYLTVHGKPLNQTGFLLWHGTDPSNFWGIEDCGGMFRGDGRLVDLPCETTHSFFCEMTHPSVHN